MSIKPENLELQNKILLGVHLAQKKLLISSAEKDLNLVIADKFGNVSHVPAKELLKQFIELLPDI